VICYKFALNPKVKGYIEWQLEHYHDDKKQLEEYKNSFIPSGIANYSETGGCSGGQVGNPTERAVMAIASNRYIASLERSIGAIDAVLTKCDETDKKLIDLVYWRRSYTVVGAAYKVNISKSAAYKRINKILTAIATEAGAVCP